MVAVAVMAIVVIPREERYLEGRFGTEDLNYKASARRWLSASGLGPRAPPAVAERRQQMRNRRGATVIILLIVLLGAGCNNWRGLGFRASGPEMPRLRQVLALKPGMSVADVGAGKGEVTVALAAEVGPSGYVFSTEIDSEALEQLRAVVAAATLENVTVVQAHAHKTGLPTSCCDAILLRRVYHHLTHPATTNRPAARAAPWRTARGHRFPADALLAMAMAAPGCAAEPTWPRRRGATRR